MEINEKKITFVRGKIKLIAEIYYANNDVWTWFKKSLRKGKVKRFLAFSDLKENHRNLLEKRF